MELRLDIAISAGLIEIHDKELELGKLREEIQDLLVRRWNMKEIKVKLKIKKAA